MTSVNGYIMCAPFVPVKVEHSRGLAGLKAKSGLVPLKVLVRAIHSKGTFEPGTLIYVKSDIYDREIGASKQTNEALRTVTGGDLLDFVLAHETHVVAVD